MLADTAAKPNDEIGANEAAAGIPTGFGYHLIYTGENYEKMVWWYKTLFGGDVAALEGAPGEEYSLDEALDSVVIVKRADLKKVDVPFPPGKPGILHMAWSYPSLAEILYVYREAKQNGIEVQSILNTGILIQFYYDDPDGNQVELQIDNYDTSAETQHVQRTNGMRIPIPKEWIYDGDKMVAMLEAGVPDADIFDHDRYHALVASGRY
jgi:catechol 2,3-dioxygenase-like lactoylglutathione lyase family enzyme